MDELNLEGDELNVSCELEIDFDLDGSIVDVELVEFNGVE